jgi:hypothetical protein
MGGVAAVLWPCLPGSYDPLALPVSMMSRFVSWILLAFVPIGVVWWCRDTFVGRPAGARRWASSQLARRQRRVRSLSWPPQRSVVPCWHWSLGRPQGS